MGSDDIDDLWGAVNELRTSVSELTALVREVRAMLAERCDIRAKALTDLEHRFSQATADHEARLRAVEHKVWWASGAVGLLVLVVGWAMKLAGK